MAAVAQAGSKYSWWWDSHISPKNSKWLQENLTDMDAKVKQMIKLIEEDADSFARRAEMYYKKRPELMKLVEEFYRAYRALAERYDHATGVIRQAHWTMAEAFPNHVPPVLVDDLTAASPLSEIEPCTPDMSHPSGAFLEPNELQKDASGSHFNAIKRNGAFTNEFDSAIGKKGLKQLDDLFMPGDPVNHAKFGEGGARKGLNFHDVEESESTGQNTGSHDTRVQTLSEAERVTKAETEILALKKALAQLEGEKEAGLLLYQQSLERLSNLESEMSRSQESSQGLNEQASKAEAEVQTLKEALTQLQVEREASLLQYQQCLEKISNLEKNISSAQNDAGELNERAIRAETEVQSLKQDLARVGAEKEAVALRCQQCLEMISSLEHKFSCAQEEVQRLNLEIDDGAEKLKSSELKCLLLEKSKHTLQSELESLVQRMGSQSEQLSEKQKELGRLWTCIQEERLRFVEAETAFQTLQNLHSQSQEELRSLAAELHSNAEILENMESHKQALEDEVQTVKAENNILNELKLSSSLSIKNLQDEILNLRETIGKLEQEVELRVDERNALQQEVYCLKEEVNAVNRRHDSIMVEVQSTGLDPQGFGSSVKQLQDEKSKLKEICEAHQNERAALLEKLEIMEKLLEKNAVLENSLSDLNVELENVRGKVKALEETCQFLLGEKSTLVSEKATLFSQLQATTEKLEKLLEKNNLLENSLFDVNAELEGLRVKSKSLEDSCQLLGHDRSNLISEKETLLLQLNISRGTLENLEKQHSELELKHLELKGEKESALQKVEELLVSLYAEREEQSRIAQLSERHLVDKESQIYLLQEEANCWRKEYEEELDRAIHAQLEIFILLKCIEDLEDKNFYLLIESQRLLEASKMSERLISKFENENIQKQIDMDSLSERLRILRTGLLQVLMTLDIDGEHPCEDMTEQDQMLLNIVYRRLQETQNSLVTIFNESQELTIENSIFVAFLEQLKLKGENLATERDALGDEFRIQSEQFLALQVEFQKILNKNQELNLTISEGVQRMEVMATEVGNLHNQLSDLELAQKNLQEESCKTIEEKRSLMARFQDLCEEKSNLEEEIRVMVDETIAQSTISLFYQNIVSENFLALKELSEDLDKLRAVNNDLEERLKELVKKLEDTQMENTHLKETLVMSNVELKLVESVNGQLDCQVKKGKEMLLQKENEVLEAKELFNAVQTEKTELQTMMKDLKSKYDEARVRIEDQANQILKLSSDKDCQHKELECLCEVIKKLQFEMSLLHEELGETKLREENLNYQLHEGANEIELWETQASKLYAQLQVSAVNETLFEGKVQELTQACESLELGSISKGIESEELKERVVKLEGDNGRLRSELTAYVSAVSALNDSITSLEMQTLQHTKRSEYKESQANNLVNHQYAEANQQAGEDQNAVATDALPDFQNMQRSINAVEVAVKQMNESFKQKDEMREIQELRPGIGWHQGNNQASNLRIQTAEVKEHQGVLADEQRIGKLVLGIHEAENEVLTKDIMLDQMSECSSYGLSRRGTLEADDQILELWETAENDKDGNIGLTVGKSKAQKVATGPPDYNQRGAIKQQKNKHPLSESFSENELSVDKLEMPQRSSLPREEGNRRNILERLDSDAQKLANLQITVQDLMKKVEITDKTGKVKGVEYETVKGLIKVAEEAIMKLFDANRKLTKNVEEGNLSYVGKPATESDESGSVSRRRVSEQARRGSERIGRLQVEVQRLQFLLLKLDDDKDIKAKRRIADRSPRVLLRDYLYGGTRTNQKRKNKKGTFCACVKPSTKGD